MKIAEATFVVFDTETTSLKADDEHRGIVEVAAVAVTLANPLVAMFASLVNPETAIPPEVSGVHGLTDRDVAGAQPWEKVLPRLHDFVAPFSPIVKASHNWAFDSAFLRTKHGVCTERLARHLWKDAPNYKNAVLRYWRGLEVDTFGIPGHRALGDALVTAANLRYLLSCPEFLATGIDDTDALIEFAESPILSPTLRFGNKHRGAAMGDVPVGYLEWMLREVSDLDRDTKFTVEHELRLRRGAA